MPVISKAAASHWMLVALASAMLLACSSPGRNYTGSSLEETLEVEILPNTSKMFVYRLRLPEDRVPSDVRVERGGHGEGPGSEGINVGRGTAERLHENAAYVVQQMGYCREGFLEIDSSASRFNLWLKGECKEGATDEDRKKFGQKQTLPVKLTK
jgi:hypothetical protein